MRRAPLAPVTAAPRRYRTARGDGKPAEVVLLADETVTIKDYGEARHITLSGGGAPVLQVLTSDTTAPGRGAIELAALPVADLEPVQIPRGPLRHPLAVRLRRDHADDRLVANPGRTAARARLRAAGHDLAAAEHELATVLTSAGLSAAAKDKAIPAAEKTISDAWDNVAAAKAALKPIPAKLPASQVTPDAQKAILATAAGLAQGSPRTGQDAWLALI